jgi:hypothetical protein
MGVLVTSCVLRGHSDFTRELFIGSSRCTTPASRNPDVGRLAIASFGVANFIDRMRTGWMKTEPVPNDISVSIETPSTNVRRINSTCLVRSSVEDVWAILTDYNHLSNHVPNLVESKRVPHPLPNGIRLFQEGAETIIGFEFRASLTMDMTERRSTDGSSVGFKLVESRMFQEFYGEWRVRQVQLRPNARIADKTETLSELFYTVTIKPRGLVPVQALEWRIREDVPVNMKGIKDASERLSLLTPSALTQVPA